jgi:hypothetical protein
MKDTLKMQEVHPVVGIKKLIDYYNEEYTKKREYICKDLNPSIIKKIELEKMLKSEMDIEGESFFYWKTSNINIENLEAVINMFHNGDLVNSVKGVIIKEEIIEDKIETYSICDAPFIKIEDILIMIVPYEEIGEEGVTLQLSIIKNSISLPKLEYPKNKMDMYRGYNFIFTVANYINDIDLLRYIRSFTLPFPENIDEADLYFESGFLPKDMFSSKDSYFLTEKDNYYTALDAIKRGKSIYYEERIYPYWTINTEEKSITLQSLKSGINITLSEDGLVRPPEE